MKKRHIDQTETLYAWEDKVFDENRCVHRLSLKDCGLLASQVWEAYGGNLPVPSIKDGRGCTYAYGDGDCIQLPRWARNPLVVLHEIAHSLTHDKEDPEHGKVFIRCYLNLLGDYTLYDRRKLIKSARAFGLIF